jgi:hypothetical protein
MKKIVIILFLLVFISVGCVDNNNANSQENILVEKRCTQNEDCVGKECCHATECINKEHKEDCTKTMCTMDCRMNTLDCGLGHCECQNEKCTAVIEDGSKN